MTKGKNKTILIETVYEIIDERIKELKEEDKPETYVGKFIVDELKEIRSRIETGY